MVLLIRTMFVFAVVGLLARMATAECQVDAGATTIDLGQCDKGKIQLKVNGSELNFKFQYGQTPLGDPKTISLAVGKSITKVLLSGSSEDRRQRHPCRKELEHKEENAAVFAAVHDESQWTTAGWRLWTCIGSGVALLIIAAIGGGIWYYRNYKKKQRDVKTVQPDKTDKSKAFEKSVTVTKEGRKKDEDKKDDDDKNEEKSKPFTQKFDVHTDALMQGQANKDGLKAPSKKQPQGGNSNGNGAPRGRRDDAPAVNGDLVPLNKASQTLQAQRQHDTNANTNSDGTLSLFTINAALFSVLYPCAK
ncbi:hypothetical protein M3Y96_00175300 [Aphelenchoides besseyi]|nr:hypothetical protein M3Y96_00175300 [Aphelenchoides besseyi]